MTEKTFNAGPVNLNYAEGPPGGPPLLLLHGICSRWQSFRHIIPLLKNRWHIYAPDFRGHGKSGWAESYRLRDYVPDIVSFIKNCIKEPTVLFGHSFGGMAGIMLAANNPGLVKALIIGDSIISTEYVRGYSRNGRDFSSLWRHLAETESVETIIPELKKQLIPVPGRKGPAPAYIVYGENSRYFEFVAECLSQLDPGVLASDIEQHNEHYREYQTDILLPKVQCPVLLLQGNPDLGAVMRDEDVSKALSLLPKAQHVKIEHVGHWLHLQDKEAVLKAVIPFLESLS